MAVHAEQAPGIAVPVISVHIPKTAGASFRRLLKSRFERIVWDYANDFVMIGKASRPVISRGRGMKRLARTFGWTPVEADVECVHGHFPAHKYDRLFPRASKWIWFRNPLDRLLSQYYYWERHPSDTSPVYKKLAHSGYCLESYLAAPEVHDVQTRFLGGTSLDDFAFVGIVEQMEASLELLGKVLGAGETPTMPEENRNPDSMTHSGYSVAPALRRHLEESNERDFRTYDLAVQRMRALRAQHGLSEPRESVGAAPIDDASGQKL